MARADIKPDGGLEFAWDSQNLAETLDKIVKSSEAHGVSAIDWYLTKKRRKKNTAIFLRFTVIVATAVAGVLPMFAQLSVAKSDAAQSSPWFVEPVWASIALAVAAFMLALDKFFGFSSGWMRFISTEHQIRQALHEFRLDYRIAQASWPSGQPKPEHTHQLLTRCKAFLTQVDTFIQNETNEWMKEFKDNLKKLNKKVQEQMDESRPGGLNVVVTNGDQCDAGWILQLNEQPGKVCTGKTAAVPNLSRGQHKIRIEGAIQGKKKETEILSEISPGQIKPVEVTLEG